MTSLPRERRTATTTRVRALIEAFPLAQAQAAVERMLSGRARFRVVLEVVPD